MIPLSTLSFSGTSPPLSPPTTLRPNRPHTPRCSVATSPMITTSSQSLYDVLGLSGTATPPEIKAAYRRLARSCHPDVVSVDRKDASADRFMTVKNAYATLSDPEKKAEYDRSLLASRRRVLFRSATFSPERSSGFTTRNWETDQCW